MPESIYVLLSSCKLQWHSLSPVTQINKSTELDKQLIVYNLMYF